MSNVTYVPEQDKPENQDPSVAYVTDQMTGEKTQLDGAPSMDVTESDVDVPVFTEQEAKAKKESMEGKRKEPIDGGNVSESKGMRK